MAGTATIAWINNAFFKRSITIDHTKVPNTDQTNFPVLFSGTYTYLKTVANGGDVRNANGYDIVFYSDSALTTPLKFERVFWSATTGTCEFWIKVPTVATGSDTVIYMKYGDANVVSDQQDAVNVWTNSFSGVWHVPDGTTLSLSDSLGSHNGVNSGATAVSGKIDGAAAFDGVTQYFSISNLVIPQSAGTVSFWFNPQEDFTSGTGVNPLFTVRKGDFSAFFDIYPFHGTINAGWSQTGNDDRTSWVVSGISIGTWYYLTLTWTNGGTTEFSINGTSKATTAGLNATWDTTGFPIYIAKDAAGSDTTATYMDEIRIASVVRSTDWINTEINNQNSPSTFYTISGPL